MQQDYWDQFQAADPSRGFDYNPGGQGPAIPNEPSPAFPTGIDGNAMGAQAPAPQAAGQTQNWDQGTFAAQFGQPKTPQELIALEQQLNAVGIKVMRNASGVAGKIQLPNGQIVDVINSAGAGG